jgi:hypothetical protein
VLKLIALLKLNIPTGDHQIVFNPFPADVANKRHLGSAPKSHFCDLTGKTDVIFLSDLMAHFIDLGVFILQTDATQRTFNVFKNLLN